MYLLRYIHLRIGWPFLLFMLLANMFIGLIYEGTLEQFPYGSHVAFFLYFIGCIYQYIHKKFTQDNHYGLFAFCIFAILIAINPLIPHGLLMVAGIIPTIFDFTQYLYYFTILLFSYPGILYFTRLIPKQILNFLAFCGRCSIWIYLSHQMFFILLVQFLKVSDNGILIFVITVLLSCITSFIIDKTPLLKLMLDIFNIARPLISNNSILIFEFTDS